MRHEHVSGRLAGEGDRVAEFGVVSSGHDDVPVLHRWVALFFVGDGTANSPFVDGISPKVGNAFTLRGGAINAVSLCGYQAILAFRAAAAVQHHLHQERRCKGSHADEQHQKEFSKG